MGEEVERICHQAAAPDIEAGKRSEQLGPNDRGIIINARTEDMSR